MARVFVSYSNEDHERVKPLVEALEALGVEAFWDRAIPPGLEWRDILDRELARADRVVVLWSNASVKSRWVREEAEEGNRRRILVPVLIDRVLPPIGFREVQASDLTGWSRETDDQTFRQLVATILGEAKPSPAARSSERRPSNAPRVASDAMTPEKQVLKDQLWQRRRPLFLGGLTVAALTIIWLIATGTHHSEPNTPVTTTAPASNVVTPTQPSSAPVQSGASIPMSGASSVTAAPTQASANTQRSAKSWKSMPSGTTAALNSVYFADDGQHGWAVGDHGTLLMTSNGGDSWQSKTSGVANPLTSVYFAADGRHGEVVGWDGLILATDDGGETWRKTAGETMLQATRTMKYAGLQSVRFTADGRLGWAVGDSGAIFSTKDSGATWQRKNSNTDAGAMFISAYFAGDGRHGWAVGESGLIVATEDGGETWRMQISGTRDDLWSIQFNDDTRRGVAVGYDGAILTTSDGGSTWQTLYNWPSHTPRVGKVPSPGWKSIILASVQLTADGRSGCAVGSNGTVLVTEDGGATWREQDSGTKQDLRSVHLTGDGRRAWAVGDSGKILRRDQAD